MNNAWFLLVAHFAMAIISSGHALLYKRDPRAALGWIAVSFAYPIVGPVLYYLFGINRLRTRAHQLKGEPVKRLKIRYERPDKVARFDPENPPLALIADPGLVALARSSAAVTHRALADGNALQPFFDGETAYAAMLKAIDEARHSVCLATYIFETNETGMAFVKSLAAAQARGV